MQSLITTLHKGILKQPDCTCSSAEGWRITSPGTEARTRPRNSSFLNSPRLQEASSLSTFFLSRFRHLNSLTGGVAGHCSDDSSVCTLCISNISLEKVPCELTLCEEPPGWLQSRWMWSCHSAFLKSRPAWSRLAAGMTSLKVSDGPRMFPNWLPRPKGQELGWNHVETCLGEQVSPSWDESSSPHPWPLHSCGLPHPE